MFVVFIKNSFKVESKWTPSPLPPIVNKTSYFNFEQSKWLEF